MQWKKDRGEKGESWKEVEGQGRNGRNMKEMGSKGRRIEGIGE